MVKLEEIELKTLREAHCKTQMAQAHAAVANADLDLLVVDLFQRHNLIQGRHGICLHCGAFFVQGTGCGCGQLGT